MGQRLTNRQIRERLKNLPANKSTIITLHGKSGFGQPAWITISKLPDGKYAANIVADGEGDEYRGKLDGLMAIIAEHRKRPRKTKRPQGTKKP